MQVVCIDLDGLLLHQMNNHIRLFKFRKLLNLKGCKVLRSLRLWGFEVWISFG